MSESDEKPVDYIEAWRLEPASVEVGLDDDRVIVTLQIEGDETKEIQVAFEGYFARALGEMLFTYGCDADSVAAPTRER